MDSILIVDDEKDNLEALKRLLRSQFKLKVETSPFEAFKLAQKQEFSVVVSDQRMPEMAGVDLLEKIKQVSPATTRILLTGYADMEAVVDAVNRGQIYRYVAKPWDPDDLRITLKQAAEAFHLKKELEQKNRALSKSNTELKKALDSLRLLDKAKAKFLSLISHELNTPLTVLTSFTALLKDNKKELSPDLKKAVESLSNATDRFTDIINEVLLYVRLESEETHQIEEINLSLETKEIAVQLSKKIKDKDLKFGLKAIEEGIFKGDKQKIHLALTKLIENCVTYSPKEETIKVTIEEDESGISYHVDRKGNTISSEAFDSLISSEKEMNQKKDLGLALSICRLIVEGHRGKMLLAKSDESGTRITLKFPKP